MSDVTLRKVSETATTVTFGYDKVSGADGYRYYADDVAVSRTFNPDDLEVRFAKGAAKYRVVPLDVTELKDGFVWPAPTEPSSARLVAEAVYDGYADVGEVPLWKPHGEHVKADDRMTIIADPERGKVMRCETRPGDNNVAGSNAGERSEVMASQGAAGPDAPGSIIAVRYSIFLPTSFTSNGSGWNTIAQWHATQTGQNEPFPGAQSPFHLQVTNGKDILLRMWGGEYRVNAQGTGGNGSWRKDFPLGALDKGRWHDFVFGEIISPDPTKGRLIVLRDGAEIVDAPVANLYTRGGTVGGRYWKQGYYRIAQPNVAVIHYGPTRFWTADTLEEAVAAAAR